MKMLIICTRCVAEDCEKNFKPKVQTTDKEGENIEYQNC